MSKQTAVRLSDDSNERLTNLSQRTGRTVTHYMREAITLHLDDLEEIYLAERALEELRRGKDHLALSRRGLQSPM